MDSVDFDNVKAEKAKALQRYHRLRSVGRIFRAAEVCVALLFLSWTFMRLPFAVRISGDFLSRLVGVVSSPLFMFVLGNSIVISLLAKSSALSSEKSAGAEDDVYEAFVRSGEHRSKSSDEIVNEEMIYDDKQMIVNEMNSNSNSKTLACEDHAARDSETDSNLYSGLESDRRKIYGRSKSDISEKQSPKIVVTRSLRRSETEKCRKMEESGEKVQADRNYPEDKLSNEEFQKTIEAFIAKQLMFRRGESLEVVLHNQASDIKP